LLFNSNLFILSLLKIFYFLSFLSYYFDFIPISFQLSIINLSILPWFLQISIEFWFQKYKILIRQNKYFENIILLIFLLNPKLWKIVTFVKTDIFNVWHLWVSYLSFVNFFFSLRCLLCSLKMIHHFYKTQMIKVAFQMEQSRSLID
jgi:hypothetical protein